jgi:hypothetical protein
MEEIQPLRPIQQTLADNQFVIKTAEELASSDQKN